jgi:serpin B
MAAAAGRDATPRESPQVPDSARAAAADDNRFAFELFGQLRANRANVAFSPASVRIALGMTYAGAADETRDEMAKTLHFSSKESLAADMQALETLFQPHGERGTFQLRLASRLWAQQGLQLRPEYVEFIRTNFRADPVSLDFDKHAPQARQAINQWVQEQTEKRISDLIPSTEVIQHARLVLTNAVYFQGGWLRRFDKNLTKPADFHASGAASAAKAQLMNRVDRYLYVATEGLQLVELPYNDKSLSMVVLLPQKADGVAEMESRLTALRFNQWLTAARLRRVNVFLPRFKSTGEFPLRETLAAMGMRSAFSEAKADFTPMTGHRDLFLSALLHKAFVDVNEEGTVAAASTGVIAGARSASAAPPVFRADHPFVFVIRDDRSGAILFLGRVLDPNG